MALGRPYFLPKKSTAPACCRRYDQSIQAADIQRKTQGQRTDQSQTDGGPHGIGDQFQENLCCCSAGYFYSPFKLDSFYPKFSQRTFSMLFSGMRLNYPGFLQERQYSLREFTAASRSAAIHCFA